MTKWASILLAVLLAGCSGNPPPDEGSAATPISRVAELEAELAATRATLTERLLAVHAELKNQVVDSEALARDYEQRLALKQRRIDELEKQLRQEKAQVKRLRGAQPTANVPSIVEQSTPASPSQPAIVISGVRAREAIVETRSRPRVVELEETYRDDFGNVKPVTEIEQVPDYSYGFRVSFTAANTSDQPKSLVARAGAQRVNLTLQPGEVRTNITLRGAMGSGLLVQHDGGSERFELTYEREEPPAP